jgi:hypothetical protein
MIRLTLEGLLHLDGTYDLDLIGSPLTNRELHWIKEIAGVRLGEFEAAADAGDNDLLVAFSVIALSRAGKVQRNQVAQVTDYLWDADGGKIMAEEVLEVGDAGPPEVTETEQQDESMSSEKLPSSSDNSNGTGDDHQETLPVITGVQS